MKERKTLFTEQDTNLRQPICSWANLRGMLSKGKGKGIRARDPLPLLTPATQAIVEHDIHNTTESTQLQWRGF